MDRCAVFVDAGYLFAQGTAALCGSKSRREYTTLKCSRVVAELAKLSEEASGAKLLRVYWYDGARQAAGLTQDHAELARCDNVKLRLGFVNSQGQQKGVDSLIVTDLIELARNGAVSDAVLMSGDEDVRIGVQIAQSYGVRVHLLGIVPQGGSQSLQLIREADTTWEWGKDIVEKFLSVDLPASTQSAIAVEEARPLTCDEEVLREVVGQVASELTKDQVASLVEGWKHSHSIPSDVDRKLLAISGQRLARIMENPEKAAMRRLFRDHVKSMSKS